MEKSKLDLDRPGRTSKSVWLVCVLGLICIFSAPGGLRAQSSASVAPAGANDAGENNTGVHASSSSSSSWMANADLYNDLPDDAQPQTPPPGAPRYKQTKRILGIIPNFRAVSTDEVLLPQSTKEKFLTTTQDSFDYSAIVIPALLAGYSMETDATPEFHQGAAGYARYFWHSAVDQTSENYMVAFFGPVLTHEDSRYYTMGRGGLLKRAGYALSRAVVTRSDSGKEVFNISEVGGAGAAAGLSSLYYPSRERSFSNTAQEWGLDVAIDAGTFVFKEFWPDINHHLFHGD